MAKTKSAPALEPTTQEDVLPETAVSKRADKVNKGLQSQLALLQGSQQLEVQDEPAATPEEETWKKRHGDLRRYTQQKEDEYKNEITNLQTQINQLSAMAQQPMPKTKEEFDAFVKKYPDIVVFIEMIADMKASERTAALKTELDGVQSTLNQTKEEKDMAILKGRHPDLETVLGSDEYLEWKDKAPNFVVSVLDNSDNPNEIADCLDMYKKDTGKNKAPASQPRRLDALDASVRNSGVTPSKMAGSHKFTISQIKAMGGKEFEANEAAIEDARLKGLILDDTHSTRFPTG